MRAYGGPPIGELRALRWTAVDFDAGVIRVQAGWDDQDGEQGTKTRAGQRTVPLAGRLRAELARHRLATGRGETDREGLLVVAFPQHDARMIPASARPSRRDRRKAPHPRTAPNSRVTPPTRDTHAAAWRIDKPIPRTNIDAIIALAMAVERAERVGWL